MRLGKLSLAALLITTVLNARPSEAQLTFYTDRASFLAATSSTTTIDFEGLAADNNFVSYAGSTGVTLSGVNFSISSPTGALFTIGKDYYYPGTSVLSSQDILTFTDLIITLPTGETALGIDLGSFDAPPITFNLSTGDTFTANPTVIPTPLAFIGVISAAPITSLTLTDPSNVLNIDNFTFGASAVPEPGSIALLAGMSVTGTVFLRRRKQVRKTI